MSGHNFSYPVQGGVITSDYGLRFHPIEKVQKFHTGIDIAAPTGTPVYAAADGRVKSAGNSGGAYGIRVILSHDGTAETYYSHLSKVHVRAGQRVTRGQLIGEIGTSGKSTGPHLHFDIKLYGAYVDPLAMIGLSGYKVIAGSVDGERLEVLRRVADGRVFVEARKPLEMAGAAVNWHNEDEFLEIITLAGKGKEA
jgi:murein DD-endopeptidase MepM/ murein hydrolase activator NlpD